MWLEPLSQCLVFLTLLGQTAAAPATAQPIVTRQPVFAIPFSVDQIADPARRPMELQLHVSTDRGAHWQLYAKAQPTQKHFLFRAGPDGEYWFAIRTVDRFGQVRPEKIAAPGLRVLVDTSPQRQVAPNNQPSTTIGMSYNQSQTTNTMSNSRQLSAAMPNSQQQTPAMPNSQQQTPAMPNSRGLTAPGAPSKDLAASTAAEPKGSVAIAICPAIGKNLGTRDGGRRDGAPVPGLPPGERPRMVNSRSFELEFDVDSVGPSGIAKVELWGARDSGRTWRSFTTSNSSPLLVNVDEEGIYGFRVVATNGAGVGGKPPAGGDLPDLWIGVDLTKPTARLVSVQQGVDVEAGHLSISWQADDKHLAARPVSLSFSQTRSGPWLSVASGLENSGRYAWPIDGRTPAQFYLRLEVRDEAGNVGVHESSQPVTIDQSRPTIRVRDVRPVGAVGARPVLRW